MTTTTQTQTITLTNGSETAHVTTTQGTGLATWIEDGRTVSLDAAIEEIHGMVLDGWRVA